MDQQFKGGTLNHKYKERHHNINATTQTLQIQIYYILSAELIGWPQPVNPTYCFYTSSQSVNKNCIYENWILLDQ